MQRVDYVSGLVGHTEAAEITPASVTGVAHGQRNLIVPERVEESFHWIAQTQRMFARGEWRIRQADYDNAPFGRSVNAASPYRWWLALVARIDQAVCGGPVGIAVERAAGYADPLLHALLLISATGLVAWRFGAFAAALLAVGLAGIFPFAAGFLPGVPNDHGLANAFVLGSVLVLLAGVRTGARARRWFALAGIVGGMGVWINPAFQVPILAGIMLGALIAAWTMRRKGPEREAAPDLELPWRLWAGSGATTILVAYLAEYFPSHLDSFHLEWIHPLYGLAWIGGGELLARGTACIQGKKPAWRLLDLVRIGLAFAAVAALPVAMKLTDSRGFLVVDSLSPRLTNLPGSVVASSFGSWVAREGMNATVWATLLPLVVVLPAVWWLFRRATGRESRALLALAFGPVLIGLGFAFQQLSWWSVLDGALLVVVVASTAQTASAPAGAWRWLWSCTAIGYGLAGVIQLLPSRTPAATATLTTQESQELIERHLAHWLAKRTEEAGAVVYAPPRQALSLAFYGGLRALGTFAAENRDGFGVTLFITAANSMEEAQELIQSRGVRYIIIPSWDPFFEEYARLYFVKKFANRVGVLIPALRHWNLPLWVRPLPYQMPVGGGFEGQSVLVFEVVEEQTPAVAASRLAEYLVESGKLDEAAAIGESLRRFPVDIGALAARAQVQAARGDLAGATQTLDLLLPRLSAGADRVLPWDRRVSLSIVLARGDRVEQAREQVRRCVTEIDAKRIRALSAGSLYNFLVLTHAFNLEIADPALRALALDLLPGDLRSNL